MKKKNYVSTGIFSLLSAAVLCCGCEKESSLSGETDENGVSVLSVTPEDVAFLLANVPVGDEQIREVFDAVNASSANGYDEEYTMRDLFDTPGAGVGDSYLAVKASGGRSYDNPMRSLLSDGLRALQGTKASVPDADEYLEALAESDLQIYWPYSADWDGEGFPVITFDPETEDTVNIGYAVETGADGIRRVTEVLVDEEMAKNRPVWVVNRNSDAAYKSIEILRREDPEWGRGGSMGTKAVKDFKTLTLKSFTMRRHFDCWFAGASEFFVKCGSVNGFNASTDAEMALYYASVTDFMVVVKRKYLGVPLDFNAILVSEWTDQMEDSALIIVEDDGGTRTSWKCSATVKYNSKSYGFEMEIPLNTRDDIVWRGQLSRNYIEKYSGQTGRFGDVDLILSLD